MSKLRLERNVCWFLARRFLRGHDVAALHPVGAANNAYIASYYFIENCVSSHFTATHCYKQCLECVFVFCNTHDAITVTKEANILYRITCALHVSTWPYAFGVFQLISAWLPCTAICTAGVWGGVTRILWNECYFVETVGLSITITENKLLRS